MVQYRAADRSLDRSNDGRWTKTFRYQFVSVRPGREAKQEITDDEGLGPKARSFIRDIDAVPIWQEPIRDYQGVAIGGEACTGGTDTADRIYGVPFRPQEAH
jgi:hypothetical protein